MGDRANIVIQKDNSNFLADLYFYTHWQGYSLPKIVQDALIRGQERWDDASYLARIIFCKLVEGEENDLTGYGISNLEQDNEHPFVIVNIHQKTVSINNKTWTFKEYIQAEIATINKYYNK